MNYANNDRLRVDEVKRGEKKNEVEEAWKSRFDTFNWQKKVV